MTALDLIRCCGGHYVGGFFLGCIGACQISGGLIGVVGGEGGEVVGADDVGGGLLQEVEVKGVAAGPDVGGEHGGADAFVLVVRGAVVRGAVAGGGAAAGKDAVLVGFSSGAVAGVEVFGDGFDGEDTDACGERAVEGSVKVGGGDWDGEGEGGDLGECVDSCVGAAGALGKNGFAGDAVDGVGEGALDGGEIGLDLPTVIGGSVVGEDELPVRHG